MSVDLGKLAEKIAAAGIDTGSIAYICAPKQAVSLSLLAGPHFQHRIIESASLTSGTVVAVAANALFFAGEGTPEIDVSKQAVLHFSDTPAQISTAGTPPTIAAPTQSTFQTDTIALRCISRITWFAMPGAVAAATGCTW